MNTGAGTDGGSHQGLRPGPTSHHPLLRTRPPALLQVGTGAPRGWGGGQGGGGGWRWDSELPQEPGWGGRAEPRSRRAGGGPSAGKPGGGGAEGGSGEARRAREGERETEPQGAGRGGGSAEGAGREGPGAAGGRRRELGSGGRGGEAAAGGENRRGAWKQDPGGRAGAGTCVAGAGKPRSLCAGAGRAGAPCGSQCGRRGHPAGARAGEGAWARGSGLGHPGRPTSRRLRAGGARGRGSRRTCPVRGERPGRRPGSGDGGWAQAAPGGSCGAPGARSDAGVGARSGRGGRRAPRVRGCDSPAWPLWPRGAGAAPCRPGRGAARRGAALSGGELKERPGWNPGSRPEAWGVRTGFVTLGRSLHLCEPQFAHLSSAGYTSRTLLDSGGYMRCRMDAFL